MAGGGFLLIVDFYSEIRTIFTEKTVGTPQTIQNCSKRCRMYNYVIFYLWETVADLCRAICGFLFNLIKIHLKLNKIPLLELNVDTHTRGMSQNEYYINSEAF